MTGSVIQLIMMILLGLIGRIQADSEDLVTGLDVPYSKPWYSGYLDAGQGKQFHYVFFESQGNKNSDPVLLWLNGGPGCSSLDGMLYEHGPFMFSPTNSTLKPNPWAWNKLANVLYIESPGSVGFSKGPVLSDDDQSSLDNLAALLSFFKKFPDFASHELYLSGESYGGIYVPYLAMRIDQHNAKATDKVNLKGWMVGNACTHPTECYDMGEGFSRYTTEFFFNHAFYSEQEYKTFQNACGKDFTSTLCNEVKAKLADKFEATNTSVYNLYNPCYVDD
jgi:serine carboxypeptidase-like clade 2